LLAPPASLHNPVDMLAAATPQQYANCLQILLADPGVHSVMVILPPPPMHTAGGIAKAIIPVIYTAEKPVVIALMGERLIQEAVEHFRAAHVPEYRFPERAAAALAVLVQRAEYLKSADVEQETGRSLASPLSYNARDVHPETVRAVLEKAESQTLLSPADSNRILEAYAIPTLRTELARSAGEAAEMAEEIGFPVAMKLASPDITHKSEVGGVLLQLEDSHSVREGFARMIENARRAWPEAEILGMHVQRMVAEGQEVIIGAVQDEQFGPLVMFGSGGIEVEGLKDVQFALAPLGRAEAESMLENTWAGVKLHGFRNLPAADRQAVLDALLHLAQLAADFPQLAEIEINPLRVLEDGQGAVALDVRARIMT